jgi:hypothetical protein
MRLGVRAVHVPARIAAFALAMGGGALPSGLVAQGGAATSGTVAGQRLGDLRRLIRQYGRTQDKVFPGGTFFKGGTYGADVNFPVHVDETNNPQFTGCADRNA